VKNSGTNWLGQTENDALQRVYGISFPDKDSLKKWNVFQEQAREKDHRRVGGQQELFFFHGLSPGSGFFLTHGARIYNKLVRAPHLAAPACLQAWRLRGFVCF
jgi:threonyl-tRNA synthetase